MVFNYFFQEGVVILGWVPVGLDASENGVGT